VSLENVFIQILHGPNGGAHVDVNVGFVLPDLVRIVRHDPSVIQDHPVLLHTPAVVSPTIHRVLVLWQGSFLGELLGEAFGTYSLVVHARLVGRKLAARTM